MTTAQETGSTTIMEARTRWLRQNAAPDAVVMSELPRVDYLYSGLHTVDLSGYTGETQLLADLDRQGVDYLVSGPGALWTNTGTPVLDKHWQVMTVIVEALIRTGRLSVAYTSPEDLIVVYHVAAP